MRRLVDAGIDVGLGLAPVLPGLTDDEAALDRLLERVRAAGVTHMFANVLFLRSPTREKYFDFLAREFPRYLEAYRRAYAGASYLSGPYRERIEALVRRLRETHGVKRDDEDAGAYARPPEQLGLFSEAKDPRLRSTFGYRLLS